MKARKRETAILLGQKRPWIPLKSARGKTTGAIETIENGETARGGTDLGVDPAIAETGAEINITTGHGHATGMEKGIGAIDIDTAQGVASVVIRNHIRLNEYGLIPASDLEGIEVDRRMNDTRERGPGHRRMSGREGRSSTDMT